MSVTNMLMKNLIDMGIVKTEDNVSATFDIPEKNIYLELNRKRRMFPTENSNFICSITYRDTLGRDILDIQMSELDMMVFIDNLYAVIDYNYAVPEVYQYILPATSNSIYRLLSITNEASVSPNSIFSFDSLKVIKIFDAIDERLLLRNTLTLTSEEAMNLAEKLYYTFLLDINRNTNIEDANYIDIE